MGKSKHPEPVDIMVTPDKKFQGPAGSTTSTARRILVFSSLAHKDLPEAAGQAADGEEVQSKQRAPCAVPESPEPSAGPSGSTAAARSLFGICPSSQKMAGYFQAAEVQVGRCLEQSRQVSAHTCAMFTSPPEVSFSGLSPMGCSCCMRAAARPLVS